MSIQERIESFYMSHDEISYGEVESFADDIEQIVRADEARKHHQVEVQGGTWPICCSTCKTHVRPHFMCVLDSRYDGPLPEGHSYEGTTT